MEGEFNNIEKCQNCSQFYQCVVGQVAQEMVTETSLPEVSFFAGYTGLNNARFAFHILNDQKIKDCNQSSPIDTLEGIGMGVYLGPGQITTYEFHDDQVANYFGVNSLAELVKRNAARD